MSRWIRSIEDGELVRRRLRRSESRFVVVMVDDGFAIADAGEVVLYTNERACWDLARYLNALEPSRRQLDALLGEGEYRRLLRRIRPGLRFADVCHRCGASMAEGAPAFWHPLTGVVRHVGRCPRPAIAPATRKPRKAA
ncbi:MAG TPA: hypothetical protein VFA88_06765 [Gaiellaceae bacterium]|nr:hypothetical protein [Gaiellaceae bacterium]